MRSKYLLLLFSMITLILSSACSEGEVHEEEFHSNAIRIYDVEPLEKYDVQCDQHYMRVGILPHIEERNSATAPFANQIEAIEKETGAEIEYVVLGSWEELRQAQEEFSDANVTEMILFNNTYDESIIKEATSGKYANMDAVLEEYGFYEEDAYNQQVLQAGTLETGQMLVPILYNVSGMIHGDAQKYDYDEWKELAYGHADEAYIDYEDFIGMLNDAMMTSDAEAMEIPFLSGADYEDKINLFLSASGMRWDSYEEQEKLFSMLYEYLSICQETKTDTPQLYMDYIKEKQATTFLSEGSSNAPAYLPLEIADDLQIDREDASMEVNDVSELFLSELIVSMFDRTDYFVENTGAEDIAFHSVFGLLSYRNYYVNRYFSANASVTNLEVHTLGNMEYWPIGIYGSKYEYAAQPLCYAAVVEGGDTRLAAKVLQSMMNQETDIKFGISVSKAAMEKQLESWLTTHDYIGNVRVLEPLKFEEGVQKYKIIHKKNYWGTYLSNRPSTYFEDKEIYTEQIDKQIKNITIAQIPDRELLTIWEESLMEAVGSNLSKEEGFALLCERMESWYK